MNSITCNIVKVSRKSAKSILSKLTQQNPQTQILKANNSNVAYAKYITSIVLSTSQIAYSKLKGRINGKKFRVVKETPKDTVILYQFPRAYYSPSLSPFALKLETWCRATGVKYQNQFGLQRGAKGLIPFIKLNNYIVDDSSRCIEYLTQIFDVDINSNLSIEQKAQSHLIIKVIDDSMKWTMALFRFKYNPNGMKDNMLPRLAYWNFSYRVQKAGLYAGYGAMSKNELYENAQKDLRSLSVLLGNQKYFFGNEKPTEADLALFGLSTQLILNDTGIVNKFLRSECQNIIAHYELIKDLYWEDWNDNILATRKSK